MLPQSSTNDPKTLECIKIQDQKTQDEGTRQKIKLYSIPYSIFLFYPLFIVFISFKISK